MGDGDGLRAAIERSKRERGSTDRALRQYRERRESYDAKRDKPVRAPEYREQRGMRRGYRV